MQGRPVLLQRYPNGARRFLLLPEACPGVAARLVQTTLVSTPNGTTRDPLVAADIAHLGG